MNQIINVLQAIVLTDDDKMLLTPTYRGFFSMCKVHQDATLLPMDLRCEAYRFGDSGIPAVGATASLDDSGQINLTVSNSDPNRGLDVTCEIRGGSVNFVNGRLLSASTLNAHNTFTEPEVCRPVPFTGARLEGQRLTIQLPAKSVVALALSADAHITNP